MGLLGKLTNTDKNPHPLFLLVLCSPQLRLSNTNTHSPSLSLSLSKIHRFPSSELLRLHQMEVEAHAVSAFDLNHGAKFPAYSFPAMSAPSEEAPDVADQMSVIGAEREEETAAPPSSAAVLTRCPSNAAMKVQKVYRSYRTRRMLADSAVVAEELWYFDF